MRGRNGKTEYGAEYKGYGGCYIRRKALIFFKLDHIHTDGLDDLLSSDSSSSRHNDGAKDHKPWGNIEGRARARTLKSEYAK